MTWKPATVSWGPGYTEEQRRLLGFLDHVGNNAWDRNGQTDVLMPNLWRECAAAGVLIDQITDAMAAIGYSRVAVRQLERWESKRTGTFDKRLSAGGGQATRGPRGTSAVTPSGCRCHLGSDPAGA